MQAVIMKHLVNTGFWWMWHFICEELKTSYSSDLNDILEQLVCDVSVYSIQVALLKQAYSGCMHLIWTMQENCQHGIGA